MSIDLECQKKPHKKFKEGRRKHSTLPSRGTPDAYGLDSVFRFHLRRFKQPLKFRVKNNPPGASVGRCQAWVDVSLLR